MEPDTTLPVGKVTFTPYEHDEAAYARFVLAKNATAILAEPKPFVLDDRSSHMLARQQALLTIVAVVKRLVETATFTLSAEDFFTLEQALNAYETSQ